jgi:protein SCO1/2
MTRMRHHAFSRYLASIAVALAVGAIAVACGGDDDDDAIPSVVVGGDDEPAFRGVLVSPPPAKPNVVLTDTEGEDYNIREETDGYLTLLYLGYTHCPDVCPTHMLDIDKTLETLGPEIASQVKVLFVTTDPDRDTPEALRTWLDLFNEDFVGLTGELDVLEQLQRDMGMAPAQQVPDGDEYLIEHGSYVLAFDKGDNIAHLVYPLGVTREDWAHDIEKLVREGWQE